MLLLRGVIVSAGEADYGVNRSDHGRTTERFCLIDKATDIGRCGFLILRAAAKIATWPHAGADTANREAVLIRRGLYLGRIDVFQCFDWDLNSVEAPLLELREQFDALSGERGSVEEGVEAEAHGSRDGVWF